MVNFDSLPPAVQELLERPSSSPPKGVQQNLDNPRNYNDEVLPIAIICIILVGTSVFLRIYSRVVFSKRLRIEDYLGILAVLPYIGLCWAFFDYIHKVGFFVHQWDLRNHVRIDFGVNNLVMRVATNLAFLILKTAVLLDWQRIFVLGQTHRTFFWISTFVLVLNILVHTTGLVANIAGCQPVKTLWYFWIKGKCIDRKDLDLANSALNVIVDIFILLLPQRIIWGLQMSRSRKLGVSIVFSIGLLTVVAASGRLYSVAVLDYPKRGGPQKKSFDTAYHYSQALIWMQCETTCIFLVFCVPVIPKIFAESGIVSQIAMSLRSWTQLGPRSPPRSSPNDSEPHELHATIGSAPTKPRPKRSGLSVTQDEEEAPGSSIQLTVIPDRYIEHAGDGDKMPLDPGILRTVEFEYQDDATSRASTTAIVERQHPWAEH